ncbi:MAG TPA: capsule assembly Wzi family protein, partial [Candidatus Avacidaminococcus intestinavium]|nr:capsule assembly Wzi family protein [Candidatus Avacidaminococcus intestinavium]
LKLKNGSVSVEFGKQALFWGQGKDASLILGNAATPLTMLRVNLEDPEPIGGFFKFLGRNTSQIFVASLESDRAARALANGNQKDYDRATLLGLRTDFMPTDNFTFGLTRVSMLGGKAHGLSSHDWKDWFLGTNANSSEADRWNDIAGIDFRYRFPALEVYGELYGEDQAGYLPSQTAQKLGFYLPRLTRDGAWDLNLEYSKTTSVWYDHSAFQNGWTYKDSLLGDYMGPNAEKYLLTLGHYQSGKQQFMLNASTMKMERNTITPQKVHELSLTHKFLLQDNLSLKTQIGIAKIDNAGFKNHHNETTRFLGLSLNYTY